MTTFRALTTNIRVDIDDDAPNAEVARAIIGSYPPADSSELHYQLRARELLIDGTSPYDDAAEDLLPRFELDLYEQVASRAAPGWLLHAAAIEVDDRALVLCGASGAGKTTLTLALAARGLRLLTEEMVLIDGRGIVRGLPRPIHVSADSEHHARVPAGWARVPYPIRERGGELRQNLLAIPPPSVFQLAPLQLHTIVRIGHGPDWPVHLRAAPPHEGLQKLWDRSLRRDHAGLEAATAVLGTYGSYELKSTSETEALTLLESLLK